jgi:hypothetical protein
VTPSQLCYDEQGIHRLGLGFDKLSLTMRTGLAGLILHTFRLSRFTDMLFSPLPNFVGTHTVSHHESEVDAIQHPILARHDPLHPLLATKLHAPRPRTHLVPRAQLTERLQQGLARPLILVSAPAGFGKTTLLARWLWSCRNECVSAGRDGTGPACRSHCHPGKTHRGLDCWPTTGSALAAGQN